MRWRCRIEAFMRRRTIQVRIFRGEKKYVAECMDLPVVTEGETLDEVTANIREAIALHLEDEDLAGELDAVA
jgi:predicted RNase H-like HicB family nuclease